MLLTLLLPQYLYIVVLPLLSKNKIRGLLSLGITTTMVHYSELIKTISYWHCLHIYNSVFVQPANDIKHLNRVLWVYNTNSTKGSKHVDIEDTHRIPVFETQQAIYCLSYFGIFFALCCHVDLCSLALFQVLCIPFVPLQLPSPHLLLLHEGASWSCTHSCHAACQYAFNPATFHFPWGLGATEFLLLTFNTLRQGVLFQLSVSLQSESTKARAYHIHFSAFGNPVPQAAQRGVEV